MLNFIDHVFVHCFYFVTFISLYRNYLSIPKLQRCNRWSLGTDKLFHPILSRAYDYESMLGLKLNHVSKIGPGSQWRAIGNWNRTLSNKYPFIYTVGELRSGVSGFATIYATGSHRLLVQTRAENLPHKNNYSNLANERDRIYYFR